MTFICSLLSGLLPLAIVSRGAGTNLVVPGAAEVSANGAEQVSADGAEQVSTNGAEQVSADGAEQVSANGAEQVSANGAEQLSADGAEYATTARICQKNRIGELDINCIILETNVQHLEQTEVMMRPDELPDKFEELNSELRNVAVSALRTLSDDREASSAAENIKCIELQKSLLVRGCVPSVSSRLRYSKQDLGVRKHITYKTTVHPSSITSEVSPVIPLNLKTNIYFPSTNPTNDNNIECQPHEYVAVPGDAHACSADLQWKLHYGTDEYDHEHHGLHYIETSIPGPGLDLELFQQMPRGCLCGTSCYEPKTNIRPTAETMNAVESISSSCFIEKTSVSVQLKSNTAEASCTPQPEACECLSRTCAYYKQGLLLPEASSLSWPVFECNDDCACYSAGQCPNRLVQLGPRKNLQIIQVFGQGNNLESTKLERERPDKGLGIVTSSFIPRGAFVCQYAGELIGEKEARQRFAAQELRECSNYIMVLKENFFVDATRSDPPSVECSDDNESPHLTTAESRVRREAQVTIIDPTCIGNIGRYLNHSCAPNVHVMPVRINSIVPVAAMFTIRDVMPGEELVYDYGSVATSPGDMKCKPVPTHVDSKNENNSATNIVQHPCVVEQQLLNIQSINAENRQEIKYIDERTQETSSNSNKLSVKKGKRKHGLVGETHDSGKLVKRIASTGGAAVMKLSRKRCYCGSLHCRGFLPAQQNIF